MVKRVNRNRHRVLGKGLAVLLVVLLVGVLLVACSRDGGDEELEPVRIGCLIPFSGVETHNGLSMQYGAEIAAEMVNAAGGINGREIELYFEDTTGEAQVAVQKANRLVREQGCEILIGTLSTAETYAVYDFAMSNKVILMNPTFYTGALQGKYFFSTGATPSQVIFPLMDYAKEKGLDSYYFIGSDYVWGRGSIAAAIRYAGIIEATVLGDEYVPFGTTDFSSNIGRIEGSKAAVIFPFVAGLDGATFLKQLNDFGVNKKAQIVGDYFDELLVPALPPEAVEGIVNTSGYYTFIDTPENKAFLEKLYQKDANALMGNFGANMYHNVLIYAAAANKAGTTDTDAVIEAMKGITINGLGGLITISAETQHAIQNIYMAVIKPDKSFELIKVFEQVVPEIENWKE